MRHYQKDPITGKSRIVLVPDNPIEVVPIVQPVSTTLGANFAKRVKCTVEGCGKLFATEGVAAIHFWRNHAPALGIARESSKEAWRGYVEKLNVPNG